MAAIVVSVPVLAKRTRSAVGTIFWISSGTSISISVAVAKCAPLATPALTAATNLWVCVPKWQGSVGHHPVYVAIAVHIVDMRPFASIDKERVRTIVDRPTRG